LKTNSEHEQLLLSAWLHDTGYAKGTKDHEETASAIAEEFLSKHGYTAQGIKEVKRLIMATKMDHEKP